MRGRGLTASGTRVSCARSLDLRSADLDRPELGRRDFCRSTLEHRRGLLRVSVEERSPLLARRLGERKPRLERGKRTMGLEPTTPGLGSRADGHDARRRPTTIASSYAGLRPLTARRPAWLRESVLRRLGQEWATAGQLLPEPDHGDVRDADRRDLRAPRARLGGVPVGCSTTTTRTPRRWQKHARGDGRGVRGPRRVCSLREALADGVDAIDVARRQIRELHVRVVETCRRCAEQWRAD